MNVLEFRNPVFHPGLNVTVRAGNEFVNHPSVKPGVTVTLQSPGGNEKYGYALIVATKHFPSVAAIPPDLLRFEHMPTCRSDTAELDRQLVKSFGPDYGPDVTLIFFYYPFNRPS